MSAITATLRIEDDMSAVVGKLFRQFPNGTLVQLAMSEVTTTSPMPTLEEYRQQIATARAKFPHSPWQTTAETMAVLREGE